MNFPFSAGVELPVRVCVCFADTAVLDSYLNDFKGKADNCIDAMAITGGCYVDWRSKHPEMVHKYVNNFVEAAGEAIIHGGCTTHEPPTDIETRRNHFVRPPAPTPPPPLARVRGHVRHERVLWAGGRAGGDMGGE